jgi:hypothetical protein
MTCHGNIEKKNKYEILVRGDLWLKDIEINTSISVLIVNQNISFSERVVK